MGDDNISFMNMDNYRGGGGSKYALTFEQIVAMQLERCIRNGSVEWHGGYWNEVQKEGGLQRTYIQNAREVFINSVKMFKALLFPYFDQEIKKDWGTFSNKLKVLEEKKEKLDKKTYSEKKVDIFIFLLEKLIYLYKRRNFFNETISEDVL